MSIKVRCSHCGWLFKVDPAYSGARCRCKHCGGVTDVPADSSVMPALPRPQKPEQRPPTVRVAEAPPLTSRDRRKRWMRRIAFGSVPVLAAAAWFIFQKMDLRDTSKYVIEPPVVITSSAIARLPDRDALQRLPRKFLDQDLTGESVAWLLGGGSDMNASYEGVTTLIAAAMARLDAGKQRFGLYLVNGDSALPLRLTVAGDASLQVAINLMKEFRPAGSPDLLPAFREVLAWKPKTVFVVVSQPTNDQMCTRMIQDARAADLPVSLLIIGDKMGWARLALETQGGVQRVHQLTDLRARVDQLLSPATSTRSTEVVGVGLETTANRANTSASGDHDAGVHGRPAGSRADARNRPPPPQVTPKYSDRKR